MAIRSGALALGFGGLLLAGCTGLWGNDEFERYSQRTDAITMSAGDAKETNAVTHMYHPWPPGVYDRQILADGQRSQRALERYRRGTRPNEPLPNIGLGGTTLGELERVPAPPPEQKPAPP